MIKWLHTLKLSLCQKRAGFLILRIQIKFFTNILINSEEKMKYTFYFSPHKSSYNCKVPDNYKFEIDIVDFDLKSVAQELFTRIEGLYFRDLLAESCYSEVFYSFIQEANVVIITVTYLYDTVECDTFVMRFDYI